MGGRPARAIASGCVTGSKNWACRSQGTDRLKTATATLQLVERLHRPPTARRRSALASAEVATSESAMGECLINAGTLAATLDGTNWEIFEAIDGLTRREEAAAASDIRPAVEQALRCDEHVKPLAADLQGGPVEGGAAVTAPPPPPTPTPPPPGPRSGRSSIAATARVPERRPTPERSSTVERAANRRPAATLR